MEFDQQLLILSFATPRSISESSIFNHRRDESRERFIFIYLFKVFCILFCAQICFVLLINADGAFPATFLCRVSFLCVCLISSVLQGNPPEALTAFFARHTFSCNPIKLTRIPASTSIAPEGSLSAHTQQGGGYHPTTICARQRRRRSR